VTITLDADNRPSPSERRARGEVPGVDTDWDISSRSRPTTAKSSLAYSLQWSS